MVLCSLQAAERLPKAKRTEKGIDLEMKQHPIKCLVCGVHFHLPVLTNDQNLLLGFCWGGNCFLCEVFSEIVLLSYDF